MPVFLILLFLAPAALLVRLLDGLWLCLAGQQRMLSPLHSLLRLVVLTLVRLALVNIVLVLAGYDALLLIGVTALLVILLLLAAGLMGVLAELAAGIYLTTQRGLRVGLRIRFPYPTADSVRQAEVLRTNLLDLLLAMEDRSPVVIPYSYLRQVGFSTTLLEPE